MQNHKAWLKKAKNDLIGAKVLFEGHINDLAVYHSHQCAEKALKSFLAFNQSPIQKSHDLVLLTEYCSDFDPSFEQLRTIIESLNPLGTLMRYPNDLPDPNQKITQNAINDAEFVLSFVKSRIQPEGDAF